MRAHIGADAESGLVHHVVKTRFRGLAKNTAQLTTLFALSNLWNGSGGVKGLLIARSGSVFGVS